MAVAGGLVILLIAVIVVGYRTYKYEQVSIKFNFKDRPGGTMCQRYLFFSAIYCGPKCKRYTASEKFHNSVHVFDLILQVARIDCYNWMKTSKTEVLQLPSAIYVNLG